MPPKKRSRKEAELEDEYSNITDDELRKSLKEIGENPGPIDATNKGYYVRMLVRKKVKLTEEEVTTDSVVPLTPPSKPKSPHSSPYSKKSVTVTTKKLQLASPVPTYSLTATPSVKSLDIQGLVAATFTPFTPDGEVNLSLIKPYADFLSKQGVTNVFVNGSTGEGVSLTVEERMSIAEEWIRVAGRKMKIIIHVGTLSLKNTCDLARHAEIHNAAGIGLMPPCYFKPPSLESLILYLKKVGDSAPQTPMLYYHIPSMTGVTFSMVDLLGSASVNLPTFRGIKYTDFNLDQYSQCVSFGNGKYPILYGCDQQILGALSMGGTAAVGSTYNYCGRLNNRLFKAFNEGDMATALFEQKRSQEGINILKSFGSKSKSNYICAPQVNAIPVGHVAASKAIMKARGFDVGPPRLPLLPLSSSDYSSLVSELNSIGFMEWA